MPLSPAVLVDLLLVLPLAGAALVWLPWLVGRGHREPRPDDVSTGERVQDGITVFTSVLSMVVVLTLAGTRKEAHLWMLYVDLDVDALSIYFLVLVSLVAVVASFYVGPYWRRRRRGGRTARTSFYCLFSLFHFTMALVPMVSDLVILWIGIELTTVTSTVLIAVERTRQHLEAAWKYIIITSAGIIFALLGTLFLATAIPTDNHPHLSMQWPNLVAIAPDLNPNVVRLAFLFVLVGYGAKAGLAPMHTWLPDAHGEAPYPVSALLSGVLLKTALYVVLRFIMITNATLGSSAFTSGILITVGLLSLVTAIPLILKKNRFKRILAYHSLEHMGIITVGLGIGGPIAMFGALLHILNHGVTKSLMFLAYGNVQDNYRDVPDPEAEADPPGGLTDPDRNPKVVGVLRAMPVTGTMLAFGGLALVGSPPFSIFLSELLILWGGVRRLIDSPTAWLTVAVGLFVISVMFIFAGLVRHLGWILMGAPPAGHRRERPSQYVPLLALFAIVVLLGVAIPTANIVDLRGLIDASVGILCGDGCR